MVHIVSFMTAEAARLHVAELRFRCMATIAVGIVVLARQVEVCETMIKQCPVKLYDVRIPAFVIGVTISAFILPSVIKKAVKADRIADVQGNVFVAVEAKRALLAAIKCLMARAALGFVFGMPLDNVARHDQGLDLSIGVRCYEG